MSTKRLSIDCNCTPVYDTRYGGESGLSPSMAIVEAIAALEGVVPTALDPLFEEVDPQAIDRLFDRSRGGAEPGIICTVPVKGWNVFVRGDGAIRVCDPDRPTESAPAFDRARGD